MIAGTASASKKAAIGIVDGTTAGTVNTTRSRWPRSSTTLRTQIDQMAADSGFNGVNCLNGDGLTVEFNENGTSVVVDLGRDLQLCRSWRLRRDEFDFQTDVDINAAWAT